MTKADAPLGYTKTGQIRERVYKRWTEKEVEELRAMATRGHKRQMIAAHFGVTDISVIHACRRYNVPLVRTVKEYTRIGMKRIHAILGDEARLRGYTTYMLWHTMLKILAAEPNLIDAILDGETPPNAGLVTIPEYSARA